MSDEDEVEGPAAGDLAAGLEAADSDTDSAEGAFRYTYSLYLGLRKILLFYLG